MVSRNSLSRPVVPMHVADREVEKLIDLLERAESRQKVLQSRKDPRIPFRRAGVVLSLEHPGQTSTLVAVWTRNISSSGVGILMGAFVHPGTRCQIELPRDDAGTQSICGVVQWCRLIQGIVHEVGIKFEEELDLELFINVAVLREHRIQDAVEVNALPARELDESVGLLLKEVDQLIQSPRLSRAMAVCEKLCECGERMAWEELSMAASNALTSLRATNSVARSEAALRKLRRVQ